MLADALDIEESDVLRAVNEYTDALFLLDQYDHQALCKPDGNKPVYRITYEECVEMVGKMSDSFHSDVFGVEKEAGKVAGIIAAVYQRLSDGTLVAITLMIAESRPEEKDVMVKLVMNLLNL